MSRKQKYSHSQRLSAVLEVIDQHKSLCEVARNLGTDHKQIRRWVALYEHHGLDGLQVKSGSYSDTFKLSVIRHMHENQLSLFDTAVKFGIPSDSTVLQWERVYLASGSGGLSRDNRSKMKKKPKKTNPSREDGDAGLHEELKRLRAENAYLKKLRVLVEERVARENGNGQQPSRD